MRTARLLAFVPFLFLAPPAASQVCVALAPSGQPALAPMVPMCIGAVPLPVVYGLGNPGFALASFAPAPIPMGAPTFLVLGLAVPPVPIPAPPLAMAYGGPGFLTNGVLAVIPAGPAGPVPGPPVPIPIPPTGGPVPPITVHTLVLLPPFPALTGATGITI